EAHCVSEWGHDFRPDYRRLRTAAGWCRTHDGGSRPPMAAFTATATPEVRDDIVALLGLEDPQVLVAGFDRPNIHLRVEPVLDEGDKDWRLPALVRGRRALVYAATRKTAEGAATYLEAHGVTAAAYHAGVKDEERTRVQDAFAAGSLPVVCATNAFGMGIDRPRCRRRRPLRHPGIGGGLLSGDRPRRARPPSRDGDAPVGLRGRAHAEVPDRQPAARQLRPSKGRD